MDELLNKYKYVNWIFLGEKHGFPSSSHSKTQKCEMNTQWNRHIQVSSLTI